MRILVAGANGQVASALTKACAGSGVALHALGRPALDIRDIATIRAALDATRPDIIVNAAAYTAVDDAESHADEAFAINAQGAANIARVCAQAGVPLVHLSTDYVFDGKRPAPYVESDLPSPLSVYGHSKLRGEELVAQAHPHHLILRTAWVYSAHGRCFPRTMLRAAMSGRTLRVVDDQFGNPTSADAIASTILTLADAILKSARPAQWGVFHMAASGETSWHAFARAIFDRSEAIGGPHGDVIAIPAREYPAPAPRPANSRLNCAKLLYAYGLQLPPVAGELGPMLEDHGGRRMGLPSGPMIPCENRARCQSQSLSFESGHAFE